MSERLIEAVSIPPEPEHGAVVLDRDGIPWQQLGLSAVTVLNGWGGEWGVWVKPWVGTAPPPCERCPDGSLLWPLLVAARGPLRVVTEGKPLTHLREVHA